MAQSSKKISLKCTALTFRKTYLHQTFNEFVSYQYTHFVISTCQMWRQVIEHHLILGNMSQMIWNDLIFLFLMIKHYPFVSNTTALIPSFRFLIAAMHLDNKTVKLYSKWEKEIYFSIFMTFWFFLWFLLNALDFFCGMCDYEFYI